MGWATSSSARAALLATALLIAAAGPASAQQADDDAWSAARRLIAEGMFLESSLGDYAGACELYERALDLPELDPSAEAELLFRLGEARQRLGDHDTASAMFERVLSEHGTEEPWGDRAHVRLLRIEERAKRIHELPATYRFDADVEGWLHAGAYRRQGGLTWTSGFGHLRSGAVLWSSPVAGQSRDDIYLCLAVPGPDVASVELWVRALDFPAHLILLLVEDDGTRYAAGRYVLEPIEGWTRIRAELDDFYLFPGEDVTRHPDSARVEFLILEDATSTYSTDRGLNRIVVDDVKVE